MMMTTAIAMIVLFQCYWIARIYSEEKSRMQKQADIIFKELVYQLQLNRFKADTMIYRLGGPGNLFALDLVNAVVSAQSTVVSPKKSDTVNMVLKAAPPVSEQDTLSKNIRIVQINTRTNIQKDSTVSIDSLMIMPQKLRRLTDSLAKRSGKQPVIKFVFNSGKTDFASGKTNPLVPDSLRNVHPLPVPPVPTVNSRQLNKHFVRKENKADSPKGRTMMQLFRTNKPVTDSLSLKQIDSGYMAGLRKAGIYLPFTVLTGYFDSTSLKDTAKAGTYATSITSVGFVQPRWYQAVLLSPDSLVFKKMLPQIGFSLLLILFTSVAFVFLYRNIASQQKLAIVKDEFISNVTHELKTPIATVQVAVEALKNFNALDDPKKTKEYLDITTAELQRLSMLVDNVLKLSMFESGRIILNKEWFDFRRLLQETIESMKLQFQKAGVGIVESGLDTVMNVYADKLHISSVLYNLLDNALKYSRKGNLIELTLSVPLHNVIELRVKDNGIGIAPEFQQKIFEKFFRVPSGDIHNVKGYGLGLSYVSQIVAQHNGLIEVESELGKGSTFILRLPIGS